MAQSQRFRPLIYRNWFSSVPYSCALVRLSFLVSPVLPNFWYLGEDFFGRAGPTPRAELELGRGLTLGRGLGLQASREPSRRDSAEPKSFPLELSERNTLHSDSRPSSSPPYAAGAAGRAHADAHAALLIRRQAEAGVGAGGREAAGAELLVAAEGGGGRWLVVGEALGSVRLLVRVAVGGVLVVRPEVGALPALRVLPALGGAVERRVAAVQVGGLTGGAAVQVVAAAPRGRREEASASASARRLRAGGARRGAAAARLRLRQHRGDDGGGDGVRVVGVAHRGGAAATVMLLQVLVDPLESCVAALDPENREEPRRPLHDEQNTRRLCGAWAVETRSTDTMKQRPERRAWLKGSEKEEERVALGGNLP
ncbi:hypothetical protein EYF80_053538 [Liparis tanakae]|uniref:Uncharacterized protein n=1 Tax=Liparis tanakae TaxID=230148 RepID=A0A4Z2F623_9TELE|nr:hypothetical protein EYF80_053538 [Liparis tanakae]